MSLHRIAATIGMVLGIPLLASGARAQFSVLETEHLRLIYTDAVHSFLAPYAAQCFENAYRFHHRFWDYRTSEKITVSLFDIADYGNAGAGVAPRNKIGVLIAPSSYAYETLPANERMNATMNHELVHIVAFDKAAGSDRFFRKLFFGKVNPTAVNPLSILYGNLTTPRVAAPRWFHEGIAVFMETWMAGGLGRALGAYDEMVFRTMVLEGSRFYDPVSLESEGTAIDFQVGVNSYLYGTRFMSYLAYRYSPEQVIAWVSRTPGSDRNFAGQFRRVFGAALDSEWSRWVEWEAAFQQANLDSIRLYPTATYRSLADRPLGSVSRAFYDGKTGRLYAGVNYPGQVAHLAAIDVKTGRVDRLTDIKGAALYFVTSPAWDPDSRMLFYTTDNDAWRDLVAVDVATGKSRTLMEDVRTGDLAFNRSDRSLWGVRHYNGISTLVRIPHPYHEWNQIYSLPYGRDLYDIDLSPDGGMLVGAYAEISGRQRLIAMKTADLLRGDTSFVTLFDFDLSLPANFTFSEDGRYLYGSSYYSGVSNVFRYDFARDSMEAVTNAETGFFRPVPYSQDSLIAFRYSRGGFLPVMLRDTTIEDISAIRFLGQEVVERHPVVREWMVGSPASVLLDSVMEYRGKYHALGQVRPAAVYPIVEGYKDYPAYGLRMELEEPIGKHKADLSASYTPNRGLPQDERWHVGWSYRYLNWSLQAQYNGADFYDLFGPTKTSRRGYSAGLGYRRYLIYDPPRSLTYFANINGYWDLERLPDYQNVSTSYDNFGTFSLGLGYSNLRTSLGAVDYEKGHRWLLLSRSTYVLERLYPRFQAGYDHGVALPLHHSALWLRGSAGWSPGDRLEPFANFYFGGFGNNWVDHQAIQRYRGSSSFPGVELNAIGGTNYLKGQLEWTLPPLRFRRLGNSTFYLTWARLALFSTGIVTNVDEALYRQTVVDVGSQIDFRFKLLSQYAMTFSLGYAVAFETYERPRDEWMFSFKIL